MCEPEIHVAGPGPEWYREQAEALGRPWPAPVAMTRAAHAHARAAAEAAAAELERVAAELEAERASDGWRCPLCGGPGRLPTLAATLAYLCGYAQTKDGGWSHA